MPTIQILDTTGGEADQQSSTIGENQVAIAQDVDFYRTTMCNRRNGSAIVVTGLASEVNSLLVHRPTDEIGQLWALDAAGVWASFSTLYARSTHTPSPNDVFTASNMATGATLHGKLFLAARTATPSGLNRLHVWDGTTLRRTGMIAPAAAPTAADSGSGGYSGRRYFRVRYVVMSGSTVLRRSEPSAELTFTPSGTGGGVLITKPAATNPDEGETHWEIEEAEELSVGDWYRIARVVVGTTTYLDTIALPQLVPVTTGVVLSAAIGEYNLQGSYRWVCADRDRLIGAGNFEDAAQDAAVEWSVVGSDTTGVGNDERRPTTTGNRLDLDGQVSGPVTGLFNTDGRIVVFKRHRTYELTHTGNRKSAYLPRVLSNTYGAIEGSVVEGVDKEGRPALFFVDPNLGPMALTQSGFTLCGDHLRDKFRGEINFDADHVVNAVYHAQRGQVWWHFAGVRKLARGCCPPADTLPEWGSFRWVFDVRSGGTSFHSLPRLCHSAAFWPDKPIIAAEGGGLVRCDHDDATDDYGYPFRAYIRTRAMRPAQGTGRFVVRGAVIEGRSIQSSPTRRLGCSTPDDVELAITLVRDYNVERKTATFNLDQQGTEEYVIKPVDDAAMNELTAVQVEIGDASAISQAPWVLYNVALSVDGQGKNIK